MIAKDEVMVRGNREHIWQKYCGFLELSLEEYMELQEHLLLEQVDLLCGSPIAEKLMPRKPGSVAEFRRIVPLTRYDDYAEYLDKKDDDALGVKPYYWACTSGRGGRFKWVPYTERGAEMLARCGIAALILACADRKGEVNIGSGVRALHNMPPPPYVSGVLVEALSQMMDIRLMPPLDPDSDQDFQAKIQAGFGMALRYGVDVLSSLSSVLITMGERFAEGPGQFRFSWRLLYPPILWRLIRATIIARRSGRPMLPKDLWPLKGMLVYGIDTDIFKDKLLYYWGREPMVTYGAAESGTIATPAWNKKAMTFMPLSSFREFIPEAEWLKSRKDSDYQPRTVLMDELQAGQRYEVVLTHFYGMPFLRYRIGDLIKIVALEDEETGVKLPQMVFDSRADDLIDIAGFARLDEKTLWQAIVNTGVKYADWSARKENEGDKPVVHIYIELKERLTDDELAERLHRELAGLNSDYGDLEGMLGMRPLRITRLAPGSFQNYYEERRKAGADLAHLKPPHMGASDDVVGKLLSLGKTNR
ncbi:GH3 auxin-responsive promoter family protein [Chloroflexota bacterium]